MEQIEAVVLLGKEDVEIRKIKKPTLKEEQILVKVRACALCTNDARDYIGENKISFPYVGGHEFCGEIVEIGKCVDKKEFPIGAKVVPAPVSPCGSCYFCRRGEENLCVNSRKRTSLDKAFSGVHGLSQYVNVYAKDVYVIDESVPFEFAALAEPMACVLNSIERCNIKIGDDVLILGGGIMGILHTAFAKMQGARVILSEPNEKRRQVAKSYGADILINPMEEDVNELVKQLTNNIGVEVVVNTTAISALAKETLNLIAPMGRIIMYSSLHPNVPFEVNGGWFHSKEVILTGAQDGSVRSFRQATNLLSKGLFDPSLLIHKVYDYKQAKEAYEESVKPDTYRSIIKFD